MKGISLFLMACGIALFTANPLLARSSFSPDKSFYYELTFQGGGGVGASADGDVTYATGLGQFEFGFNLFTVWNKELKHRVGITAGLESSAYHTEYDYYDDYYAYNRFLLYRAFLDQGIGNDYFIYQVMYWDFIESEISEDDFIGVGPMVGFNYHFRSGSSFDPYVGIYFVNQGGPYRRGIRLGAQLALSDRLYATAQVQGESTIAGLSTVGTGGQVGLGYRF